MSNGSNPVRWVVDIEIICSGSPSSDLVELCAYYRDSYMHVGVVFCVLLTLLIYGAR